MRRRFLETKVSLKISSVTASLVFVFKIISTFVGQNPKFFFMHVLKKDVKLKTVLFSVSS